MIFRDNAILLYRISDQPADRAKRIAAETLLDRSDCALSLQVLNEIPHQSTRRSRPDAIPIATAWTMISSWRRCPIQGLTLDVLDHARTVQSPTSYPPWDSLIVAAAHAQGCEALYTEDR